jgi:hypothetical protein
MLYADVNCVITLTYHLTAEVRALQKQHEQKVCNIKAERAVFSKAEPIYLVIRDLCIYTSLK